MTYQNDLDQYRKGRGYPVADDALLELIERRYQGGSFLIVNSQHGLFGQRLIDRQGITVVGIEPDMDRVAAGMEAGVKMQSHNFELNPDALLHLGRMLEMYGTTGLIIRGMVNTLADHVFAEHWDALLAIVTMSNVYELFIEDDDILGACQAFDPPFYIEEAATNTLSYMKRDLNELEAGAA